MKANISQTKPLPQAEMLLKGFFLVLSAFCLTCSFYYSHHNRTVSEAQTSPVQLNNPKQFATNAVSASRLSPSNASNVVSLALAFKAMLTNAQQTTLQQTYTTTLARNWSNLPCGASCRNGIEYGSLTNAEFAAAQLVIQAALGTDTNNGFDEWNKIRIADYYLKINGGGNGYDSTLRWICFLNTPSDTGAWMLQFGGHHYAANIAFHNGHVIGATPFFMGLEPTSFPWKGDTIAPLNDEHDAFANMLASLTAAELATAKINSSFTDCVMIPGETNGGPATFPAVAVGQPCSTLTSAQQDLIFKAISEYIDDMDTTTAASVMAVYKSQINSTYVSYTGSGTSGSPSSFLNTNSNYVRISGPTLWIEFVCQNGIVFPNKIHYHTVWRDRSHDYGVDLSGSPIDTATTTGIAEIKASNTLSIYPNPTSENIYFNLPANLNNATVTLIDMTGRAVYTDTHFSGTKAAINVSSVPAGNYIIKVQDQSHFYSGKFNKQ